jgi:hypothetical protein
MSACTLCVHKDYCSQIFLIISLGGGVLFENLRSYSQVCTKVTVKATLRVDSRVVPQFFDSNFPITFSPTTSTSLPHHFPITSKSLTHHFPNTSLPVFHHFPITSSSLPHHLLLHFPITSPPLPHHLTMT